MIAEILFIFLFSLILVSLLVPVGRYGTYRTRVYGRRVPVKEQSGGAFIGVGLTMLFFFFLIFPLILAVNSWITPYGPVYMGVSWVPIIFTGLALALLLAAVSPRRPKVTPIKLDDSPEEEVQQGALAVFGLMFFFLLILAFSIIIAGYV